MCSIYRAFYEIVLILNPDYRIFLKNIVPLPMNKSAHLCQGNNVRQPTIQNVKMFQNNIVRMSKTVSKCHKRSVWRTISSNVPRFQGKSVETILRRTARRSMWRRTGMWRPSSARSVTRVPRRPTGRLPRTIARLFQGGSVEHSTTMIVTRNHSKDVKLFTRRSVDMKKNVLPAIRRNARSQR